MTRGDLKKRLVVDMGFSDKKAEVYLSLLEIGEAKANEIAKRAKLKRTTVYNILPELLQEGLIRKYRHGNKTMYHVDKTEDLVDRLEEKRHSIGEIIPELNKIHMADPVRSRVTQYEGRDGLMQLYKDMLDTLNPGEELLSIIAADYAKDLLPYHTLEYYSDLRRKKKIPHRIIGTRNEFILHFKSKDKDELRETRIFETRQQLFGSDIRIFGNKVATLTFKEGSFLGVVVESEDLSNLYRELFERVWGTLSNN